jgi:hypothetical protein
MRAARALADAALRAYELDYLRVWTPPELIERIGERRDASRSVQRHAKTFIHGWQHKPAEIWAWPTGASIPTGIREEFYGACARGGDPLDAPSLIPAGAMRDDGQSLCALRPTDY